MNPYYQCKNTTGCSQMQVWVLSYRTVPKSTGHDIPIVRLAVNEKCAVDLPVKGFLTSD